MEKSAGDWWSRNQIANISPSPAHAPASRRKKKEIASVDKPAGISMLRIQKFHHHHRLQAPYIHIQSRLSAASSV
jgi:hypothetical protein